jgi:toxin-antitoxin system PIN domain toxin
LVLAGFVRIVTHPRVFDPPSSIDEALAFVETLRERPNRVGVSPGERHWTIFSDLCRRSGARGNLVPDAYLAALAIESGAEWITTDGDYARFPGLRVRHPLES